MIEGRSTPSITADIGIDQSTTVVCFTLSPAERSNYGSNPVFFLPFQNATAT